MRVSDTILANTGSEKWLGKFVKKNGDDVVKLYLVYNEKKFGLDSAREIFDRVVGLDFIAEEDSGIVSNEDINRGRQQGIHHVATVVPDNEEYHWWVEISLDKDIVEVVK